MGKNTQLLPDPQEHNNIKQENESLKREKIEFEKEKKELKKQFESFQLNTTSEIEKLKNENENLKLPWWKKLFHKK